MVCAAVETFGVKVKLNTAMDKAAIAKKGADVVVVATGSKPITIDFGKEQRDHYRERSAAR